MWSRSAQHKAGPIIQFVPVCVLNRFSCVRLFETPWTVALQAPLSMGFSRQEYCCGLPCLPPEDFPKPGLKSASLIMSPALAGGFFTTSTTWEALKMFSSVQFRSSVMSDSAIP